MYEMHFIVTDLDDKVYEDVDGQFASEDLAYQSITLELKSIVAGGYIHNNPSGAVTVVPTHFLKSIYAEARKVVEE